MFETSSVHNFWDPQDWKLRVALSLKWWIHMRKSALMAYNCILLSIPMIEIVPIKTYFLQLGCHLSRKRFFIPCNCCHIPTFIETYTDTPNCAQKKGLLSLISKVLIIQLLDRLDPQNPQYLVSLYWLKYF